MDLARWQEIKQLVAEALDLPDVERPAYLDGIAEDDLRPDVAALLAVSTARADVFDRIRVGPLANQIEIREGDRLAGYTILRPLGRGGMSAVYLAEDTQNERSVALKVLHPRLGRSGAEEHRMLARLTHPNIARLYESGATETGLRYVAMEYVDGSPLIDYCNEHCPSIESRLHLFQKICAAVAYAHQNLVVHRDLKPGNIVVSAEGEPKLLDFGIAKLLPLDRPDPTVTRLEDRALTVAFASPEQLSGEPTTTATDVYSLGVLLCVLLTGRLPYTVRNTHDLPWAIRNLEPEKPSDLAALASPAAAPGISLSIGPHPPEGTTSKLRRQLQGDLDAIVLRTLRKEPDQRYRSVGDLSEDVRRYLESEPVRARRGTRSYRVGKFMRRHRNGVLAGAVALILLAGAVSALIREERRVARERDRAEAVAVFLVDMFRVPDLWTRIGQTITANEVLDNALTKLNTSPPDAPGARGTLLHSLGKIYFNLGLYTPAETLMTPALADLEAIHGKNHPILAEAYRDLAILHYQQGRYGEAERSLDRAIAIAQELPEKERPQASDTRLLLGHIAFARGNFSKAEQLFREAANLRTRTYGREHPAVASVLNDLGCALHEQGRFAEARELYQRSLEIRRKHFGEQHALVLQSLHNQARLDEDEGNFEAAEALYQTIFPSRQSFGYYNPTHTLLYQNMGSLFLSQGIYDQAGLRLDDTLSLRRRTFPDHHPDVARAAAELGRLAHALKRYDEAAPLYRDSYARLSSVLGPDHPDCLVVANNLAALLAETGKFRQAEALWQKLAQQASRRRLRPHILRTIEGNRALLHAATNEQPGHPEYRTIGLTMPSLTEPSQIVAPPPLDLLRDSRTNPEQSRILFADSFDDGVLDPAKWEYGGNVVVEEGGELRVLRTVTDSGGWARTRPILIDPQRPLIIRRKVKIFAANQYFDGSLSVDITGYPEKRFGLSYANYYYTGAGECVTVGFSLFRRDANTHRYADRQANASPLLPPIWGRWFEEELIYDPRSGELRYSTDGNLRLVYSVGSLPPKTSRITLSFATWGWYTGHYQKVDDLEVRQ